MAFNINQFKSNGLVFGGARPSLFRVLLDFPAAVTTQVNNSQFLVKSAQLPASTIGSVDVGYFGRKIKLSGDRTFSDWSVTVLNDEDFALRNAFEEWSNLMNTMVSNRLSPAVAGPVGAGSAVSYKADMIVQQFAKDGPGDESGIIRQYVFVGAFPTTIGAIGLDWDTTNSVESFDVNFTYDYWEPLPASTPIYGTELAPR